MVRPKGFQSSNILAALLVSWAVATHITFIVAVPDPIFQPDSGSYLDPALHILFGSSFALSVERTVGYPLFLSLLLKLVPHLWIVLIAQHSLALLSGFLSAFIYYRFIKNSLLSAAFVFFLSAALPVSVIFAHSILSETLYTFSLIFFVWLFLKAIENPSPLPSFLSGVCAACAALVRPVGRSLIAAGMLGLIVLSRARRGAGQRWLFAALGAASVLLAVSEFNWKTHGFFGIDQMSGPALFCSTARYLDLAQISDEKVRAILKICHDRHSGKMADGEWLYGSKDGPIQQLRGIYPEMSLYRLLNQLAWTAIQAHPFLFIADRFSLMVKFFWAYSAIPDIYLNREFTFFIYRGLLLFEKATAKTPSASTLTRYGPRETAAYFARIRPLLTHQVENPVGYLQSIDSQDVYRFSDVLLWWWPMQKGFWIVRWLPFLALFSGCGLCFLAETRTPAIFLLLVIGAHSFVSSLASFQDPRFADPIMPLYSILAVGGIQRLSLWTLSRLQNRGKIRE